MTGVISRGGNITVDNTLNRPDGKQIVLFSPSTEGWATYFTGAGDNENPTPPSSGRGEGTKMKLTFSGVGLDYVDLSFCEPVELHDGQIFYTPLANWSNEDRFSVSAYLPATTVSGHPTSSGNCNLYPTGLGYNVVVPAAGDGAYQVDLSTATPIPSDTYEGYWDCDYDSGDLSVSATPGAAHYHLLDVPVETYFLKNMPMGNPLGLFDIDTYKAEWIHPSWRIRLSVDKTTTTSGEVGGWLMLFRLYTT